jgi:hypothetical protein
LSDAGYGSRILRLRRTIPLLFEKKNFKTVCLNSFTLNPVLEQARQRLFKNFLARNKLVASAFAG